MVMRVSTVAFEGIEARAVDVQVQISPGNVVFIMVGLIKQKACRTLYLSPCYFSWPSHGVDHPSKSMA